MLKIVKIALAGLAAAGSLSAQTSAFAAAGRLETVSDDDGPPRLPVGLGARIQLVWNTYDATIEYERANKSGNEIELDDELPLDDDGVGYDFRAWIRIGEWVTLDGRYLRLAHGIATGPVKNGFSFDNVGFAPGDRVAVEHVVELAWGGVRISTGVDDRKARLSVPVGLLYTSQRLAIQHLTPQPQQAERASHRLVSWTPYVGIHAEGVFFDAFGEAGYEAEVLVGWAYLDASAYVTYGYGDVLRFYAGPRIVLFAQERDRDDKDRVSEFQIYSLNVGVSIGF